MRIAPAGFPAIAITMAASAAMVFPVSQAVAQNPAMAQKVQEIKAASAANKAALAHYTWQEQQTVSLKVRSRRPQCTR